MFLFCWFDGEEAKCWWRLLALAWTSENPQVFKVLLVVDRSNIPERRRNSLNDYMAGT